MRQPRRLVYPVTRFCRGPVEQLRARVLMSRTRAISFALLITVALGNVAMAGCSTAQGDASRTTAATSVSPSASAGSVQDLSRAFLQVSSGAKFNLTLRPGETRYDGAVVVANQTARPVRFVSIKAEPTSSESVSVVQTGVVVLGPTDSGGGVLGQFPPPFATQLKLEESASVTAAPGGEAKRYVLMLVLRAERAGAWSPPHVIVTYEIGAERFTAEFEHPVSICVQTDSAPTC